MLRNCWEIKECGRGPSPSKPKGSCPAAPDHGHSCWVVAGTFCQGEVQVTFAQKLKFCNVCDVYKHYSTSFGTDRDAVKREHPDEHRFCVLFLDRQYVTVP